MLTRVICPIEVIEIETLPHERSDIVYGSIFHTSLDFICRRNLEHGREAYGSKSVPVRASCKSFGLVSEY